MRATGNNQQLVRQNSLSSNLPAQATNETNLTATPIVEADVVAVVEVVRRKNPLSPEETRVLRQNFHSSQHPSDSEICQAIYELFNKRFSVEMVRSARLDWEIS